MIPKEDFEKAKAAVIELGLMMRLNGSMERRALVAEIKRVFDLVNLG